MTRLGWIGVLVLAGLTACGAAPKAEQPAQVGPGATVTVPLGGRPFTVRLPTSSTTGTAMPLVVLLHGFGSDAREAGDYFGLAAEADRRGFLVAAPDGTRNTRNERFWNATDACCDFDRSGVDDSTYLQQLIDAVKAAYAVDAGRVYLIGHSNGGFMAYRMACEHADTVTAIVSLAGAVADDATGCAPSRPVGVLQIHGTADDTIRFDGGRNGGRPYPSAATGVERWRRLNGCSDQTTPVAKLDLEAVLPGAETTVTSYRSGCRDGGQVVLWTIKDGGHVPQLSAAFTPAVIDHLLSQHR
ncbi:alpha/beta hydrolase family esterase [Dactylosporangium siamense]|uniref:Poly(3-hydroxyalkanoate) depolymerase n=1 Tax=Dactylosporangium siamense TaxID=685454 RepID=A0A919UFD5_9ACTN|nr:alpha/beta fold hydrolase [Dactylosporangium siamense]GIG48553.1 poly(3-hydroxyalkanoate) depolymerase [Dactylosporangium siamense]